MKKILIVAGEASGDLHASNLVKALKSAECGVRGAELKFSGLGGAKMQEAGVELLTPFTKNAGTGLDPLLKITHFSQVFRKFASGTHLNGGNRRFCWITRCSFLEIGST